MPLIAAAFALDLWGQWQAGTRPTASSYGAVVYTFSVIQAIYVAALVLMGCYTLARSWSVRPTVAHAAISATQRGPAAARRRRGERI